MTKKEREALVVGRSTSKTEWGRRLEYRGPDGQPWFVRYGRSKANKTGVGAKKAEPATGRPGAARWRRVAAVLRFALAHAFVALAVEVLRGLLSSRMGRGV